MFDRVTQYFFQFPICTEQHLTTTNRNKTKFFWPRSTIVTTTNRNKNRSWWARSTIVVVSDFVRSCEVPGSIFLVLFVVSSTWPLVRETKPLFNLIVVMAIDFVGSHEVPGSIPWICQKNLVLFVLSSTWPLLIEETPYAFNLLNQCSGKWFGLVLWGSRFNPFARQVFYTEHHFATISFYTESTLLLLIEKTKAHHIYSIISVVSDLICLMSC
jgi:hypothetical protein